MIGLPGIFGLGCDRDILVANEGAVVDASPSFDSGRPGVSVRDGGRIDGSVSDASAAIDSGLPPLVVPWSTGFEGAPGDTWVPGNPGACYVAGGASFQIVTSPVHSGKHAAAFSIDTAVGSPSQTRCIEQGVLPAAAYYGAWYYVPAPATNPVNWNLLHFQGANVASGTAAHNLWDVSLTTESDGGLQAFVYDSLRSRTVATAGAIPVGAWVHLEVFLRRASDDTGEFTLRQNGDVVLDLTGLSTDDSLWGQWFVGNYALALSPPSSTLYVDDVSIDVTPSVP